MELSKLLKSYQDTKNAIFLFFDTEPSYLPVESHIYCDWVFTGDSILFYEDECEYGYDDVNLVATKNGYSLFYIRDNGDKFYDIFSTTFKKEQE